MDKQGEMSVKQVLLIGVCGLAGVVLLGILNYGLLEHILIPDPCYYHSKDTNALFDIFYDITSAEGGHPSPSAVNYAVTVIVGIVIGGWLALRGVNRYNRKKAS